ncbi:protein Nazo-like [Periplaneta americana]|uniref:protein Nazo-like n=1 Tax=Periplaneta americana TaxID=6978 RepID=UPI0037E78A04
MPINSRELLNVVTQLTEDKNVRVCVRESFKGGCVAGTTTIIGGLVMGPPGLAIGATLGGCAAAFMSRDKFKPVAQVIMQDMSHAQRERLAAAVSAVVEDLRVEDVALLLPLLLGNPGAKEAVLREVFLFLQNEMSLQIMD